MRLAIALLAVSTVACYRIDTTPFEEGGWDASTIDAGPDAAPTECPASDPPHESDACPPGEPVCDEAGICVECTANTECDSGRCEGGICACTHHTQCDSGACNLGLGACVDESDIAYVDSSAPAGNVECTRVAPCAQIAEGLATPRTYVVLVSGSEFAEEVSFLPFNGDRVLIGYGAQLYAAGDNDLLTIGDGVTPGMTQWVYGLELGSAGTVSNGIVVNAGAPVVLVDVHVDSQSGVGVEVATMASLRMLRSRVENNAGGGLRAAAGGRIEIHNSVFRSNGGDGFGGIHLMSPPTASVVAFNTIVGNDCSGASCDAPGIRCESCAGVSLHSNIITGNTGGTSGAQVTPPSAGVPAYEYSLINPAIGGTGNITGAPAFAADGYHITITSDAIDQGKPSTTVVEDIDVQPRPTGVPDIGADECILDSTGQFCE